MKEQDHLERKGVDQKMILLVLSGPELGPMAIRCENCTKENHVTE
jgi:hypothetical protein